MKQEKEDTETGSVPAVDRAVAILEYLTKQKNATIKEISQGLLIPTASAGRIVKTLAYHGLLSEEQAQPASKYSLGLKMLSFSQIVSQQLDITNIAHTYMDQLATSTNQASQLAILDKGHVMYIEMELPIVPVSIVAPLRTPIAINLSAGGKVLLAGMEESKRDALIDELSLPRATSKSITDKAELKKHLLTVKEQGYALDDEEFSQGIGCMAAPVRDYHGQVVAAVGITGQIGPYKDKTTFDVLKKAVFTAADAISKELGYEK